jgi:energy-coupling factor transporter ATP-binding protein EcfA2
MNALIDWLDDDDFEHHYSPAFTEEPDGGYIPLGTADHLVVLFSRAQKRIFKLKASELRGLRLEMVLGSDWCDYRLRQLEMSQGRDGRADGKSPAAKLASSIVSACQLVGPYVETQERGAGVWVDRDGELMVNGHQLWRPSDGAVFQHGLHQGYVYPLEKPVGFDLDTPLASESDVTRVLDALRSLKWATPMAGELLMGWLGIAIIGAAVHRRPHVLLTGPHGCGKSTVLEQLRWLLEDRSVACTGSPTLMGLNQMLRGRPGHAILLDEFEADGSNSRCQQTFEAARSSFSLQEHDQGIVRGTPSGSSVSYRIAAPFIACGISPGKLEPADQSRWVILEALKLPNDGASERFVLEDREARQLGPKLARLFVGRWALFGANLVVFRQAIRNRGGDARLGDTLGYLLAAYSTFTSEVAVSEAEAEALADAAQVAARTDGAAEYDEQECLNGLLSTVMPFSVPEGLRVAKLSLSIAQAIRRVVRGEAGARAIAARLAQLGIRVREADGRWVLLVVNSPSHTELRKLFAGTKFAGGGWGLVLRRLPGGHESTQRIGAGLKASKVTQFDLPAELLPEPPKPAESGHE